MLGLGAFLPAIPRISFEPLVTVTFFMLLSFRVFPRAVVPAISKANRHTSCKCYGPTVHFDLLALGSVSKHHNQCQL